LASPSLNVSADADIDLQSASHDIWDKKYRLRKPNGESVDASPHDTLERVAHALANLELEEIRAHWSEQFSLALHHGALPAGRILSNAGAKDYRLTVNLHH
jgi:ribonucleoside-diphosphate reductase alpha chain